MDKNFSKLISGLKWLVERRELNMIDDKLFLRLLSKELNSFNLSQHCHVQPFTKEISFYHWRLIDMLVVDASDYWQLLSDDDLNFDELSAIDAYRHGFVSAVLRIMSIFDMDLTRVVK